ncbi:MAG: hypothetical protein OXE55_00255 [Flavobacteriaceae bacterium]|nr:hypothetical protein [Flavobacteriaceae bacterium]
MSCLFFIMLVLFVFTFFNLKAVSSELKPLSNLLEERDSLVLKLDATEKELQKFEEIKTAIRNLPETYFDYQPKYKRFRLNRKIRFSVLSCKINPNDYDYLSEVGRALSQKMKSLAIMNRQLNKEVKYLLVIEGMASKDNYSKNNELSYCRARAVYDLWLSNGVRFDSQICEVQISGSGVEGIREYSGRNEYRNQQVLIHIIPKWGD